MRVTTAMRQGVRLVVIGCVSAGLMMTLAPAAFGSGAARPKVSSVTAKDLGASWRQGCPTPPDRLRRVAVDYVNFSGDVRRGSLIVHRDAVADVIALFNAARRLRFPIKAVAEAKVAYGRGTTPRDSDIVLMDRNLSSGFNCRPIGDSAVLAKHARGLAIDINPVQNPYVGPWGVVPSAGRAFATDRSPRRGVLTADHPLVRLLVSRGWRWGGSWSSADYAHFERRSAS